MTTTKKLMDASQAFNQDFDGAKYTMLRLSQIQSKMSAGMDAALNEFKELFPMGSQTSEDLPTAANGHSTYTQDLPNIIDQMRASGALRDDPRRHLASLPPRRNGG